MAIYCRATVRPKRGKGNEGRCLRSRKLLSVMLANPALSSKRNVGRVSMRSKALKKLQMFLRRMLPNLI